MIHEIERKPIHGGLAFTVLTLAVLATGYWLVEAATDEAIGSSIVALLLLTAELGCYHGLMFVYPNEARVLMLFGAYKGTAREPGWRWVNPFYLKPKLSVRVRNFETGRMKVNDQDGNPIEIAAVVVWKVTDTAEASFEVDDYVNYVHVQSESAVRNLAVHYPYDTHEDDALSLRGSTDHVAQNLREQIEARLERAGITVIEARISHLAYSPEIAEAMLRRQQAGAIIAARQKIVEGAVGMVEMALELLKKQSIVELDEERKAAMVSNLLVVLCSEHHAQPVLNTGSLYT
jgi:regulator of protease activity HflC (stomatin/prohibitin superfamily)